jgi:hypothetical protein
MMIFPLTRLNGTYPLLNDDHFLSLLTLDEYKSKIISAPLLSSPMLSILLSCVIHCPMASFCSVSCSFFAVSSLPGLVGSQCSIHRKSHALLLPTHYTHPISAAFTPPGPALLLFRKCFYQETSNQRGIFRFINSKILTM